MKTLHGSERTLIELTKRLIADGHHVEIRSLFIADECQQRLNPEAKLSQFGLTFGMDGFWAAVLQYTALPFLTLPLMLKKGEFDVIIAHAAGSLPASAILRKINGGKLIYLCQEPPRFAYDLYEETKRRLGLVKRVLFVLLVPLLKLVDQVSVRMADFVVANSGYSREVIQGIYKHSRVVTDYLGVDTDMFSNKGGDGIRGKHHLDNKLALLSVGKLHPRKNLILQLEMIKRLSERNNQIHLLIVGNGQQEEELLNMARNLGISDNIIFAGSVIEELPEYYSGSDIFIFTAKKEPYGLVVIEAMAAGKPVIVPDEGGPTETVIDGQTGLIYEQGNIDDLCQKVQSLIDNPEKRRQMGENGKARALMFSWDNFYEKLKESWEHRQ